MKIFSLILIACAASAFAETPAPDVHTYSGQFKRVVIVRMKYGTDLLEGMQKAVAKEKIQNAVVLSGHGSVTSYHIHVVENTTLPPKDAFIKKTGAFDLVGASGHIINGKVHIHLVMADKEK